MLNRGNVRLERGHSLLEVMVVLAITAILGAISYPSYASHVRKARRAEAVVLFDSLQQAQESWRAENPTYGSMGELRLPAVTATSAYVLSIGAADTNGFSATARAHGVQSDDQPCRFMRMTVHRGESVRSSGMDERFSNDTLGNDACWLR